MRNYFFIVSAALLAGVVAALVLHPGWHSWLLAALILPLVVWGLVDALQTSSNLRRTYPIFGSLSELLEKQRHVVQEVLLLDRKEGRPFNWIQKEIAYKRADDEHKSQPFGTQLDYGSVGREWLAHSAFPATAVEDDFRLLVGGAECDRPYSVSRLNIGGMSYGSISSHATQALNGGAALGGFAHNTGEGGLTPHHEKFGGDLIFQIGTGYFGCRTEDGRFDPDRFAEIAERETVKMVEIKISQGAKPGYGAILPAKKNTEEIAAYRGVEAGTEVLSPPHHSAFEDADGLIAFIRQLRDLSGGKPIGIKLCLGTPEEFDSLAQAFHAADSLPDFITIDGGEGGTGAAHLDSLHWVGMPMAEALHHAHQTLRRHGLRERTRLFAGGKILTSFDMAKVISLGADACFSARGMMLALGCVQSLKCNLDTCPTGITTMDPQRVRSLVVADKKVRVANFHKNTLHGLRELLTAAGLRSLSELRKDRIYRRVSETEVRSFAEIYPDIYG